MEIHMVAVVNLTDHLHYYSSHNMPLIYPERLGGRDECIYNFWSYLCGDSCDW